MRGGDVVDDDVVAMLDVVMAMTMSSLSVAVIFNVIVKGRTSASH